MSTAPGPREEKVNGVGERVVPKRGVGPAPGANRGPMAFMAGRSTEKSLDFKGSGKRLLRTMAPERALIALALFIAACGVALNVLGPKILGHATDLIFAGVLSRQIPADVTKAQFVARLNA